MISFEDYLCNRNDAIDNTAYETMTHDELEERLDDLRTQRDTLECEEPDDLDSEAYEEWEEQCEQLDEKIEEIEDLLEG